MCKMYYRCVLYRVYFILILRTEYTKDVLIYIFIIDYLGVEKRIMTSKKKIVSN